MGMTRTIPRAASRLVPKAVIGSAHNPIDEKSGALETLIRQSGHRGLDRVRVSTMDGRIVLQGQVSSYYLKQLAQEAVRPLAIGMQIRNELRVGEQANRIANTH